MPCLAYAGGGHAGYASHNSWPLCHVLQCAADGHARLPVQTWAGRSVDIVGRDQRCEAQDVNGRRAYHMTSSASLRETLLPSRSVVPRLGGTWPDARGQRPHPWSVDSGSPLCPSIAENHGVDERSIRGMSPGSLAGTKLGICHNRSPTRRYAPRRSQRRLDRAGSRAGCS